MGVRFAFSRPGRVVLARRGAALLLAALALASACVVLAGQTQVSEGESDPLRACGSALDTIADRSGWEEWWASDLDDPDSSIRVSLTRTRRCPAAINRRIVWAGVLGAIGVGSIAIDRRLRPPNTAEAGSTPRRLQRIGRLTSWTGTALCAIGLAAIAFVVADSDAPMFRYVDRTSVVVIGVVALTPTMALIAIGRSITIASASLLARKASDAS